MPPRPYSPTPNSVLKQLQTDYTFPRVALVPPNGRGYLLLAAVVERRLPAEDPLPDLGQRALQGDLRARAGDVELDPVRDAFHVGRGVGGEDGLAQRAGA